jgi:hypothetical protein
MRELSSQEVNVISAGVGANASTVDSMVQDGIKWITGALGAFQGYTSGSAVYPYVLGGVDIGKFGLGGVGGIVGAAAGYFLGKLLSDNVVKPYA